MHLRIFMRSTREHEAVVDIRTLDVIEGSLPRRAMALTLEWAQEHRGELMEDWDYATATNRRRRSNRCHSACRPASHALASGERRSITGLSTARPLPGSASKGSWICPHLLLLRTRASSRSLADRRGFQPRLRCAWRRVLAWRARHRARRHLRGYQGEQPPGVRLVVEQAGEAPAGPGSFIRLHLAAFQYISILAGPRGSFPALPIAAESEASSKKKRIF